MKIRFRSKFRSVIIYVSSFAESSNRDIIFCFFKNKIFWLNPRFLLFRFNWCPVFYRVSGKASHLPVLKKYMLDSDFSISVCLASSLVKLALKFQTMKVDESRINGFFAEAMLIVTSMLRLGKSSMFAKLFYDFVSSGMLPLTH